MLGKGAIEGNKLEPAPDGVGCIGDPWLVIHIPKDFTDWAKVVGFTVGFTRRDRFTADNHADNVFS
jgi:hypothetical protein